MIAQHLWFEPVSLLSRCSLNEGLLWVWADRVPISDVYREKNAFETLTDWECQRLDIPVVPYGIRGAPHLQTKERLSAKWGSQTKYVREHQIRQVMEEAQEVRQWLPRVTFAMELPATELFVTLRRGQIEAMGKLLPAGAAIIDFLEGEHSYGKSDFDHLVDTVIPPEFWTMPGIDWFTNAVSARGNCYCDVSMSVEALMSLFPGDRSAVDGAEFVGNCILLKKLPASDVRHTSRPLGRPPVFAWEAFHVEVADLIKNGRMPEKKEAAIQQMMSWFETTQGGQKPSRSAVSEKLTPYYRRFFSH